MSQPGTLVVETRGENYYICEQRGGRIGPYGMSLTINIKPEVQAELGRQAAAQGIDVGEYAATLLEEAAHLAAGPKKLSPEQLDRALEEIAQFSDKIPSLPDEAFSRESLYRVIIYLAKSAILLPTFFCPDAVSPCIRSETLE